MVMTIARILREEGRMEGLLEGREEGKMEGLLKGREEGIRRGLLKGRKEGLLKGREDVARRSLLKGLAVEDIVEITGLRREIIEEIKKKINV